MNQRWRYIVGGLLILFGILALASTVFSVNLTGILWALVFAAGGLVFLSLLISNRNSWWAAFPGFALLSIGTLIGVSELAPRIGDWIGGAIFLGGIGVSFLVVYLLQPTFWWAIIPAGALFSLTATILFEPLFSDNGWIFLLGLSLTFWVLTLFKDESGQRITWAVYPALALLAVGLLVMLASVAWAGYIWPVALIGVGLYLIVRAVRRK